MYRRVARADEVCPWFNHLTNYPFNKLTYFDALCRNSTARASFLTQFRKILKKFLLTAAPTLTNFRSANFRPNFEWNAQVSPIYGEAFFFVPRRFVVLLVAFNQQRATSNQKRECSFKTEYAASPARSGQLTWP
jgi:hypothetical protein